LASLVALAAAGSLAVDGSPSSTSAEAKPLATSDFASVPLVDHDCSKGSISSSPRKVQIRRTVRRRYNSLEDMMQKTETKLPSRFYFYNTSDCEPSITEDQKLDVLSAARPYEVCRSDQCMPPDNIFDDASYLTPFLLL
jgi:hypothetical protein